VRESAVIRCLGEDEALYWYPPGSGSSPRPLDDDAELAQLQSIADARRANLIFALPGAAVRLQEVSYTAAEKRHMSKSLPFLLEDEFASDIEDLHFASAALENQRLAVASCEHTQMERWEEQLAGLELSTQWVPEPLLLPWREGEITVVIEADGIVVRSGDCSGFTAERDLATLMLSAIDTDVAALIVYGENQVRDTALIPDSLRDLVQWRTGGFAAALMLSGELRKPLDLHQGQYGASLPVAHWWRNWRLAAGLFALAFAVQLASSWLGYSNLEKENVALRQQLEATFREVVPRGAIQDPEKQLRQQLAGLTGGAQGVGFVSLLDRIGREVQAQKGAHLASVNYSDKAGDLRLSIVAPDFGAVESIRSRLIEAGLDAETENSNTQGDAVRARLKVREK
jgi:general secretion pathway protein L